MNERKMNEQAFKLEGQMELLANTRPSALGRRPDRDVGS